MSEKVVCIFSMPQEFPCGTDSSCCGPVGQTEEELHALKQGLEHKLGVPVRTIDVKNGADMREHRQILALLRAFGWGVLPIITVRDEVVSMGPPTVEEAAAIVRRKLEDVSA